MFFNNLRTLKSLLANSISSSNAIKSSVVNSHASQCAPPGSLWRLQEPRKVCWCNLKLNPANVHGVQNLEIFTSPASDRFTGNQHQMMCCSWASKFQLHVLFNAGYQWTKRLIDGDSGIRIWDRRDSEVWSTCGSPPLHLYLDPDSRSASQRASPTNCFGQTFSWRQAKWKQPHTTNRWEFIYMFRCI